MIRLLGEIAVLVLIVAAIWALVKHRPREVFRVPEATHRVRCLSSQHPVNLGNDTSAVYVRTWYMTHNMTEELATVSALGTEEEMRYYMAYLSTWTERGEIK